MKRNLTRLEQNASSTFCKNPKNKISINKKEQHFMLSSSIGSKFYFYKIFYIASHPTYPQPLGVKIPGVFMHIKSFNTF